MYYPENYYVFKELLSNGGKMLLKTSDITLSNYENYYKGLLNLLKDGIDDPNLHNMIVTVDFGFGDVVDLSIFDLYFNIIMWYMPLCNGSINGEALFFPNNMTQDEIKKYIDKFILKMRERFSSVKLNNIITNTLHRFVDVDDFSMFFANTINLKDTIDLANRVPDFNALLHTSLKGVKIEDVKSEGMRRADESIEIIKNSKQYLGYDHCLANSFRVGEGINPRQYKEFAIHIGSKPNGTGGVNPHVIDKSYIRGALIDVASQYVDSASSRVAQIQTKKNVKSSGNFARILGINNMDTFINPDLNYKCDTHNFEVITIRNEKYLKRLTDRYFRFDPEGMDYKITSKSRDLIGKTIYLFSPMTCQSAAEGHGICRRCYGDLAYNNYNIKVGKFGAEQLSAQLTQKQLSAKHLVETVVEPYEWEFPFDIYFDNSNINLIDARSDAPRAYILIDPELIESVNDEGFYDEDDDDDSISLVDSNNDLNEYITSFTLVNESGESYTINNKQEGEMYFTKEFSDYIKSYADQTDDDMIKVDLQDIANRDISLFYVQINNNDIDKGLKEIEHMLNRKSNIEGINYDKDVLLDKLLSTCDDNKLIIQSVHLEVICMNQIRSAKDLLRNPDWSIPGEKYQILTLDGALKNSPSIVNSLIYQKLADTLTYPLSYKKKASSRMDMFFMKQPQVFMSKDNPKGPTKYKIPVIHTSEEARLAAEEYKKKKR